MEKKELEEKIVSYMKEHKVCHLATGHYESPAAHTLHYFNKGLDIYFTTADKTEKMKHINANPHVGLTIDEPADDWNKIKGIQLKGKAEIVSQKIRPVVKEAFEKKFPFIKELGGVPDHHVFVKVSPEKIYFLDYSRGLGKREIFNVERKRSLLNW
ncbi:MAG: pyridoxamine 5'-phosphate oxidase family protein [Candidatus Altiarchaeota archaeon]